MPQLKLDALKFNPDYLDFKKGVAEGRKLGARELAEWIEEQNEGSDTPCFRLLCDK